MASFALDSFVIVIFIAIVWGFVIAFYALVLPRLLKMLEEF